MANREKSAYSVAGYGSSRGPAWRGGPEPMVPMSMPAPRRVSFVRDLYNGAVLGDFAREKRLGGALMQIVCGFTPGIGTICAARDCVADARYRDWLGVFLNLLGLVPVFGGVSKTTEVIIGLWHARHVMRKRNQHQPPQQYYLPVSAVPTRPLPPPRSRR